MAASASDVFQKVGRSTATTLSSPGYTIGNTSINVGSTTNWPTDTGITFAIDETELVNGEYVRVDGTYNIFRGTVNTATQITNVVYVGGDANRNYSAGATTRVYILVSYYRENRMVDGILDGHDQSGYHSKSLKDANGNEWLKPSATTSAVNEVTITNAATGSGPVISATGDDTNADITLKAKGTGVVKFGNVQGWSIGALPAVSSVTNNGNRSYDVTFASTVASYLTPGQRIRTTRTVAAPTAAISLNGTTQYASKASPAGMTFTDNFTVSAWIRLTSYAQGKIMSRLNVAATNGWAMDVLSTGQLRIVGASGGVSRTGTTYQSIPLNKWVHVAATLNMSGGTSTTYIDGISVPNAVAGAGTSLTQGTDLVVGSYTSGTGDFFPGNISQAAVFNAVLSAATISSYMSQTLSGSETSLISAYKLDQASGLNDLNANANNLTATGSPTYSSASPFGGQADGTISSTLDYGIVTKVSTTVATVQVPEGCTIPTTGGVTSVDMSAWKAPYGMPVSKDKWELMCVNKTQITQASPVIGTWYNIGSVQLNVPIGAWSLKYAVNFQDNASAGAQEAAVTLSTSASSDSDNDFHMGLQGASLTTMSGGLTREKNVSLSSSTLYYLIAKTIAGTSSNIYFRGDYSATKIVIESAYL